MTHDILEISQILGFLGKFGILVKIWDFLWKIWDFLENLGKYRKFGEIWKILGNLENWGKLGKLGIFWMSPHSSGKSLT
jgi:hypothetical protein